MCTVFQSHQSTDAEHVSTVVPSIAPTKKVVSRRIQSSYSSATPRHPEQELPEARTRRIMYRFQERTARAHRTGNSFKSNRRLTHNEGLSQSPRSCYGHGVEGGPERARTRQYHACHRTTRSSLTHAILHAHHPGPSQKTSGSEQSKYQRPEGNNIHVPPDSSSKNWSE